MHPPFSAWPLQGHSGPRVPGQAGNSSFSMAVNQRASQALGSQTKKPGSPLPQLIMSWPGPVKPGQGNCTVLHGWPYPGPVVPVQEGCIPSFSSGLPRSGQNLVCLVRKLQRLCHSWPPQVWPDPGLPVWGSCPLPSLAGLLRVSQSLGSQVLKDVPYLPWLVYPVLASSWAIRPGKLCPFFYSWPH